MSSKQPAYNLVATVVIQSLAAVDLIEVQGELMQRIPGISFSPSREQPSLNGCQEFSATARVNQTERDELVRTLDNDFDHEDDIYWAYGFNTKMFDPRVYYLQLEFLPAGRTA